MSSTKRIRTDRTQKMGTNGRKACLMCNGDVIPPRHRYCSRKCANAFNVMTSPAHARWMVFKRDRGICALCKKNVFEGQFHPNGKPRLPGADSGDLWQADHIIPVVEGGGECTLENLRTLCTDCHQKETKALRIRMAERKQSEKKQAVKNELERLQHEKPVFGNPQHIELKRQIKKLKLEATA